jgi:hypothetical protein
LISLGQRRLTGIANQSKVTAVVGIVEPIGRPV